MADYRIPRPADDSAIDFVELVQPYDNALSEATTEEQVESIERDATDGQRHLWAYNRFFFEMEWNGIEFLFLNPTVELVPDILKAVRRFGFAAEERLLRKAIALFPDGRWAEDDEERQAQVEAIGEGPWEELQTEWGELQEASSGDELRRFILDHAEEFFLPPAATEAR